MDFQQRMSLFNSRKRDHNINFEPKEEQIAAASAVGLGKNCLCFLPTGFGKTLCFVLNTIVSDNPSITLVISPLISLMDDQIRTLQQWKFTVARIGGETSNEEVQAIANGNYQFVYASPESALKPKWRSIFMNDIWQLRIKCIVFDEAHCISEWGDDFRPEYKEMAQLKSFFKVPVMALTATSTDKVKRDIMSVLQLSYEHTEIVTKSSNRPNIYLECRKKKSSDYYEELKWITEYLKYKGKNAKKIIIYCRSIGTVSDIYISLKNSLGKHAYINLHETTSNVIIEMFHKGTHDSSKQRILSEFTKPDSNVRCIVATVALGMGIDIKDIDMVIHVGCPKSVISYWQEAGRCARDGRDGYSLIVYDNVTASSKTTEKLMSDIVKNADSRCLRQMILNQFLASSTDDLTSEVCTGCHEKPCNCQACKCCSFCSTKCPCVTTTVKTAESFINQ